MGDEYRCGGRCAARDGRRRGARCATAIGRRRRSHEDGRRRDTRARPALGRGAGRRHFLKREGYGVAVRAGALRYYGSHYPGVAPMRFKTLALVALGMPAVLSAQSTDTLSLAGRSSINLGIGLTGQRTASVGFGGVGAHVTGELGSLGFAHWIRPEVAITIGVASLSAEANLAGAHVSTSSVTAALFGVSYSPRALAVSSTLRPYVALAAGPYFHSVDEVKSFGTISSTVESVAGIRSAVGRELVHRATLLPLARRRLQCHDSVQPEGWNAEPERIRRIIRIRNQLGRPLKPDPHG